MKKNLSIYVGISTGLMVVLFLSGKFFNIPYGTHKGGLIGGVGVLIIIICMTTIGIIIDRLIRRKENR